MQVVPNDEAIHEVRRVVGVEAALHARGPHPDLKGHDSNQEDDEQRHGPRPRGTWAQVIRDGCVSYILA